MESDKKEKRVQLYAYITYPKLSKKLQKLGDPVYVMRNDDDLESLITGLAMQRMSHLEDHAFIVCDLGEVIKRYDIFCKAFPTIRPYYALKANDLFPIGKLLFQLGAGFDASSMNEVKQALSYGASSEDIVFAAPVKYPSHVKFCSHKNLPYMTFDCIEELHKIKDHYPGCKAILRISVGNVGSRMQLSEKYGAEMVNVEHILTTARDIGIKVVGVSFHVGWCCARIETYMAAMRDAKCTMQMAISLGHPANVLDIGGGFHGQYGQENFLELSRKINAFLENELQSIPDVRVIAEPGTFFCESSLNLVVNVIGKRKSAASDYYDYYLNEGTHGMFQDLRYRLTYEDFHMELPEKRLQTQKRYKSTLWGPTCDSDDSIGKDVDLPELFVGDSILFKNFGAYSWTFASTFGGNDKPDVIYAVANDNKDQVNQLGVNRTFESPFVGMKLSNLM